VDDLHRVIKSLDPAFELKYNKHFIGLVRHGKPDNFVVFQPRKQWLRMGLSLSQSDEHTAALESAGLKPDYDLKWRRYVLTVEPGALDATQAAVSQILSKAIAEWD